MTVDTAAGMTVVVIQVEAVVLLPEAAWSTYDSKGTTHLVLTMATLPWTMASMSFKRRQ